MTSSSTMDDRYDYALDVTGLRCPLPILRTKRELVRLAPGQVLRVAATDPHALIDFLAFTEKTPHRMVRHWDEDGVYYFLLQKGA